MKQVVDALGVSQDGIEIISGGNEPVRAKAGLKTKVSVPKNDGLVMLIDVRQNQE